MYNSIASSSPSMTGLTGMASPKMQVTRKRACVTPVAPVAVGVVDFECTYYFILLCGGLRWVIYIHIYTFN